MEGTGVDSKKKRARRKRHTKSYEHASKRKYVEAQPAKTNLDFDPSKYIAVSSKFALINKLIRRDLNNNITKPLFYLYSKDDIQQYLSNPYLYEKQLRQAITYIYGASPHFRRLIKYFVGLTDWSYIIEPFGIDPRKANTKTINNNYRKTLRTLDAMSVKTQFPTILTTVIRDDVFYGYIRDEIQDDIVIQQLPSDFCAIASVEGKVPNVTFDFSYFDTYKALLDYYPKEFKTKYSQYEKNRQLRYIELDSPRAFAIKANMDILDYPLPPFAGLLRDLYDLEDYKGLKNAKTALENYAMLAMKLPMDSDGNWQIDYTKAKEFWQNLDSVLPEEIGSVLTPMDIDKISFEKSNTGDVDTVTDAEEHLFTAAGVSSLLFNNAKASANALLLSIKADQAFTYEIVKHFQDVINRYIQSLSYGKNFYVNILDVSPFNRKEVGDAYLKAAAYGFPTLSAYAASQGIGQSELDSMSFLEGSVLGLQDMFRPVQSSTQMSSTSVETNGATDEGGAPTKEIGEVSDSRESNRENE